MTSNDLLEVQKSDEWPMIEAHVAEAGAKRVNARTMLKRIERMNNEVGRLLDMGCFCGVFLSEAVALGWDAVGIEPGVMPAIYARGKYGLKVLTGTLDVRRFEPESFDVVTASQVFEHIAAPHPEVEKIRWLLRPGGLLVIDVPNIDTWTVRLLGRRHRHFVHDHVCFFSADTLRRFLEGLGFDVVDVFYPTRALSLQHLARWISRYSSKGVGTALERLVDTCGLSARTVSVNLGDIVCVMARKRGSQLAPVTLAGA